MAKSGTVVVDSLDNVYTRDEAAEKLHCSKPTIDRCLFGAVFTKVSYPHDTNVYLFKDEVDHMVGFKDASLASNKARDFMSAYRRQKQLEEDGVDSNVVIHPSGISNNSSYWDTMKEYAIAHNRLGKMLERGITNAS